MATIRVCDLEYLWCYGDDDAKAKIQAQIDERAALLQDIGAGVTDPNHPTSVLMSDEQVLAMVIAGYKIEVKRSIEVRGSAMDQVNDTMAKFNLMAERLLALPSAERAFNAKCEVHMPGQALATYNEVMLHSDACSDELQAVLDLGWRILAACPQPDQRRPDYVLGRFNPEREHHDIRNSARRG